MSTRSRLVPASGIANAASAEDESQPAPTVAYNAASQNLKKMRIKKEKFISKIKLKLPDPTVHLNKFANAYKLFDFSMIF